jgi:signal transduction histidine kinase
MQNGHLTVDIAKDLPEIQADHDAIVAVLVNLLDNACKYSTENKQVSLKVFPDTDSVCFAVADNGIGLARRHLRKIFDRFYQVDSSLARKAEGCGLGLSIVKFIVDAHKGKITVESKPGQGSTFTVKLPIGHGRSN